MKLEKILSSTLLPSLPRVAVKLLELSKDPDSCIDDVVQAVKMDPAISIQILKSANSSYFSFRTEIKSIERAVPLLGTNVISSLVLCFSLVDSLTSKGPLAKHFRQYWRQSISNAAAAEMIGKISGQGLACENFLAGLLTDVGQLAMLSTLAEFYLPVLEAFEKNGQIFLTDAENEQFEYNHAIVGAELLKKWGLDPCLSDVARCHHFELQEIEAKHEVAHFELIKTVTLAATVSDYFCCTNVAVARNRLLALGDRLFGWDVAACEDMLEQVRARIDSVAEMFSVDVSDMADPRELLVLANEQLAQVAIRNQAATFDAHLQRQHFEQANLKLVDQNLMLRKQAFIDPLTEVYNRRFFDESLDREILRCRREGNRIGIIMIDIDFFKKLNDIHGHLLGDFVLKEVAATLRHAVRESDIVARFGGEEFIVMAHQPTSDGLQVLAERLRRSIEALRIEAKASLIPVTVSVGATLSLVNCDDTSEMREQLISIADQMLYQSKQNGRNRVSVNIPGPIKYPAACLHPAPQNSTQSLSTFN